MKEKILGAIMGLCVGDALGVPVEFASRKSLQRDPVTGMRGYGVHNQPPGTWSDDTSMTLCLLDSLAHGLDYDDIMQRFVSWMFEGKYTPHGEVFDIGGITKKALFRFGRGTEPLQCGGRSEFDNGNGSLMRILPLIFYLCSQYGYSPLGMMGTQEKHDDSIDGFFNTIHNVSSLTHAHARSHIACGIYLTVVGSLMQSCSSSISIGAAIYAAKKYYETKESYADELPFFARICGGDSIRDFVHLPQDAIQSDGYVVHTLEAALWCLLNTDSYESCVLKAANLGGDTDTTAAVAGGLAGAHYGIHGIPKSWREQLARREYIEELCAGFYISLCRRGAKKLYSYIPYLESVYSSEHIYFDPNNPFYPRYDDTVCRFVKDIHKIFLGEGNARATIQRATGGKMERVWSREFIAYADLETVQSILSYFVNKERMCVGLLAAAVYRGTFLALLHRLKVLLLTRDETGP